MYDFLVFNDEEEELSTDGCAYGSKQMLGAGEVVSHKTVNAFKNRILVKTTFQDVQDIERNT